MSMIYIILPLALLFATGAVLAFVWATRSGQFDDLETPGMRIIHEDDPQMHQSPKTADTRPDTDTTAIDHRH